MQILKDDLQRTVKLSVFPPKNIVSLVPSQTELLYDLGLRTEITGITKFCVHPDTWKKEKIIVGGTKQVNIERIQHLQPDLIIANKEENTREVVEECSKICPVYVTDIKTLNDAFNMILNIGQLVDKMSIAEKLHTHITYKFNTLRNHFSGTFLYFIWQNPYMVAGEDTFIHSVLSHLGFQNTVKDFASRYPELTEKEIRNLSPEYVLLSSEPYPFKEKHIQHFRNIFPKSKIYLADGEMFSWYGSRLLYTCDYVKTLF